MPESSDPYTYPGTNALRNLLDIRDGNRLAAFEATSTAARLARLDLTPLIGLFDVAHLRAIHKFIFQDVLPWAGDFRTVNISKGGNFFGAATFIASALDGVLQHLPQENYLKRADIRTFALRAGFYLGEINAIHPFREGNGRTQREFIRELGAQAGFMIDWTRTTREQMIAASRASFQTGDSLGLAALIQSCMRPL